MNHSFVPKGFSFDSGNTCLKCHRDEISHTEYAQCEACSVKGPCDIIRTLNNTEMLLCSTCFTNEAIALNSARVNSIPDSIQSSQAVIPTIRPNESQAISRLANKLQDNHVERSQDYFNAQTAQLADLEAKFMSDSSIEPDKRYYEFAKAVTSEHARLQATLFQAIDIQVQVMSSQNAMTVYLNGIANKLRKEEQIALKIKDVEYEPKSAPIKVKQIKQTPLERLAENTAKSMNITLEAARAIVESLIKQNKAACTCAETPGMCKAHSTS